MSVAFLSLSFSSMAWWGVTGHRVVGEIAQSYLSAKARKAIKEILGDESLAMASNWGDFIKSDSNFGYLYPWHYNNLKAV
ncbi:MAG: S1/P1 nuclease [Bacteroidota bacterium]